MLLRLTKLVPTDMNWSPNWASDTAQVGISANANEWTTWNAIVWIRGNDDIAVYRRFHGADEALDIYNKITYLQFTADLKDFQFGLPGEANNGWPQERKKFFFDDIDLDNPQLNEKHHYPRTVFHQKYFRPLGQT